MKNESLTIQDKDFISPSATDLIYELMRAVEFGTKKNILYAYELIERSDIDFASQEQHVQDSYDEYVERANIILNS